MKCKLCLQEKPLLKKSHLAPNFLYKELRDMENSFIQVDINKVVGKKSQTGLFEADILCRECDNNILGSLESYSYNVLYTGKVKGMSFRKEVTSEGVKWILCEGVDYKKFKLFLLSLIWRFSISSKEFYKFVDLGAAEEKIRKMIYEGDAGAAEDFPCFISSYKGYDDLPNGVISQPLKHKVDGATCYTVLICGLVYTFYMLQDEAPDYVLEAVINQKNKLKVIELPKDHAIKILRKYMGLNL